MPCERYAGRHVLNGVALAPYFRSRCSNFKGLGASAMLDHEGTRDTQQNKFGELSALADAAKSSDEQAAGDEPAMIPNRGPRRYPSKDVGSGNPLICSFHADLAKMTGSNSVWPTTCLLPFSVQRDSRGAPITAPKNH